MVPKVFSADPQRRDVVLEDVSHVTASVFTPCLDISEAAFSRFSIFLDAITTSARLRQASR